MTNYNYAKIIDGNIVYAIAPIKKKGYEIVSPKEEDFLREGFKKIVRTPQPQEDGYYFTNSIIDLGGIPTEIWDKHLIEPIDE